MRANNFLIWFAPKFVAAFLLLVPLFANIQYYANIFYYVIVFLIAVCFRNIFEYIYGLPLSFASGEYDYGVYRHINFFLVLTLLVIQVILYIKLFPLNE